METTDVLICGGGPTGAMLSGFLGRLNVPNIVLEKEDDITTDPRGITLDEEGMRLLQALGLYDAIFTDIGACVPRAHFISGVHADLSKKPFLELDSSSTTGNTAHVGLLCHKQPVLEKHLRKAITDTAGVSTLRSRCALTSISEDDEWVYAKYVDAATGEEKRIRSRFLVGADGKTGFTRKMYLEPKGVQMQWAECSQYQESWVALNWKINPPTKETHPDFPLWKLGYSPAQVCEAFFPTYFSFLCNPDRPAVCGRFGLSSEWLWRFEFVVREGEDEDEMAQPRMIRKIVFPYLSHPGKRYGLPESVDFPEDCIEVLRCRPFHFYARSCDKWSLGRVILSGDAAHVFPPFGGQGIASGFRDAVSLSWRLKLMCSSPWSGAADQRHRRLLESWAQERKQQLERSLAFTVRNGNMVNTRNPLTIFLREWALWLAQLVPGCRRRLGWGPRGSGLPRYEFAEGMDFVPGLGGGALFPQSFCVGLGGRGEGGSVGFTDDAIFAPRKSKMFQIVVLLEDLDGVANAREDLAVIDGACRHLSGDEATMFVPRSRIGAPHIVEDAAAASKYDQVFRTATAEEFESSPLSRGRPEARGYNEMALWDGAGCQKRYIILRFDRYVFAACSGRAELQEAAGKLKEMFPC